MPSSDRAAPPTKLSIEYHAGSNALCPWHESMGSYPNVWFFHPHFRLHFYYDDQFDRFAFENGSFLRRPADISRDYIVSARSAILAGDQTVPRTIPHDPPTYYPEQNVTNTQTFYSHTPASPTIPNSGMWRQSVSAIQGYVPITHEPGARLVGNQSATADAELERLMNATSIGTTSRRESYHAPVTRTPQTSQANVTQPTQVYNTHASMALSNAQRVESIPEEVAKLYESFKRKVRSRQFFVVGKVFLTLWNEPAGDSGSAGSTTAITSGFSVGPYGEVIHSKIRRFIVVREGEFSCTAIPVLTYNHQGVGKARVNKSEHAIIHTGKVAPEPLRSELARRGEDGLLSPIRVDPDDNTERLDPMSRIDFGKVYNIEHNVKVRSYGKVNMASMTLLLYQFRTVWEKTFKGTGSQLPIKTPKGVRMETIGSTESARPADLMRAYNTLLASGYTTEEIKKVLRVDFQPPTAGEPADLEDQNDNGGQNVDHEAPPKEDQDA